MNTRSTWLLVLLALGLSAYTYFSERSASVAVSGPDYRSFDPVAIRAVELLRSNVVIRVERTTNGWSMALPVAYGAQRTAIEAFLKGLADLKPRLLLPGSQLAGSGGTNELKAFGLDGSALTVKLETAEGAPLIYQIGGATPLGPQFYLRRVGADGVFTADEAFLANVPPSADYWRDRSLFDLRGQMYDRVEVRGSTAFTAVRDTTNSGWRLVKPLSARADSERIEALINALQTAPVSGFVSDSPLLNLQPLGLQPPQSEFILGQGTNDLVRLQFGGIPTNTPGHVLVRRLANTNVVLTPMNSGLALKMPLANFRDRTLVPSLEEATEVRFRTGGESFRVQRTGTNWAVVEPQRFGADRMLMNLVLRQIGALPIVEFPTDVPADLARYGLEVPARSVTVLNGTNELVQLDFGSVMGLDKVYVRRADEPSVYATILAELRRLPEVANQIRDLRFNSSNVVDVAVFQKGRTRNLTRAASGEWTVSAGTPGGLIDEAINETLYRLSRVESARYTPPNAEQMKALKFAEVDHRVELGFRAGDDFKKVEFQFGGQNPAKNLLVLVRIDDDPKPVLIEFPGVLYEDVFRDFSAP